MHGAEFSYYIHLINTRPVFEVKEAKVCKADAFSPSPSLMISINPYFHNLFHSFKLYLSPTS